MAIGLSDFLEQSNGREALGPDNKWYCSQRHGYEVTDPETLLKHYIKYGGAYHFRQENCCELTAVGQAEPKRS